jgi:two-component system chemotaxis response regulator CheB
VARHQEPLLPGHVYFAPDHQQMGVEGLRIVMGAAIEKDGHCPSISHLFCSVAESFGAAAVGVLLTGMGRDGASELLKMRQAGAMTIAQDRDSCVVYGMPGRAAELGAVTRFLPPARMAAALLILAGMGEAQGGT